MSLLRCTFLWCLCLLCWAGPGRATGQTVSPGPNEVVETMAPVVVTGRTESLLGMVESASAGRVGQAALQTRPLLRPGEVLEAVPGVVITQHSGSGKANQYFLRGFNLDHGTDFATHIDGVPINFPTHAHGQGYTDVNFLIPEIVDYVTYRKGPYYAEVGDFASAGMADIHLVTTLPMGLVHVGVGEHDLYRVVVAQTPPLGAGRLLYAFEGQLYNGPWDRPENLRKFNAFLKYSLTRGPVTFTLGATAYTNRWDATDQIPQRAVDQGLIPRLGTLDTSDGGRTSRYSLYSTWEQKGPRSQTAAHAYLVYYRFNLFSNFTFFLDDPERGDQFEQVDRRVVVGGAVAQTWYSTWRQVAMDHTLGLQVRHDAIPTVGLHKTLRRERLRTVRDDTVHETSIGFYYQNQTQWLAKLRTVLGVRGDVFVFDVASDTPANSGRATDAIASPKLSVVLGPWAQTEFYLNGGLGFHSNDARGTTITIDPASGAPATRVTPLVRSTGAEVGLRSTWIPGLTSTLAFWYLTLDSELVFVGDAGSTEASRPSRRYGIEWANFYQVTPWLKVDVDLSHSYARFRDTDPVGRQIPGSIETVLATGVTAQCPCGLFGSLRARYFGPRPLIEDKSVRSAATTLLHLQAGYTYNKRLTARLDVLNLLNARDHDIDYFYVSRLPGEPADGVADRHFHPVEPRAVRFYLTYAF